MNERIEKLAEQAGFFRTELSQVGPSVEKFAELIVKDCIDLVPWMYEAKIKEHFGVNSDVST